MDPITDRNLIIREDLMDPVIKFFTKTYVKHSIDNIVINQFFLATIHNFIDKKAARYRYLEQLPHTIAALIYYIGLFGLSSIVTIFTLQGKDSCKNLCVSFGTQMIFVLTSLWLAVIGSLSPPLAMNITLFYGKKVIELFDNNKEETEKICDFIKNFWSSYRIRIQVWMISSQRLTSQNGLNYQIRVMDIHRNLKTLSDVKRLFQYALQLE